MRAFRVRCPLREMRPASFEAHPLRILPAHALFPGSQDKGFSWVRSAIAVQIRQSHIATINSTVRQNAAGTQFLSTAVLNLRRAKSMCNPLGTRMGCYPQPRQLPARMLQDQKAVEQPKRDRDEHVPCDDAARVIAKEGLPPWRRRPLFPRHVFCHDSPVDIGTELEELTMIPRGAPHSGLAMLISRISSRTSGDTQGRPPRAGDFQHQ